MKKTLLTMALMVSFGAFAATTTEANSTQQQQQSSVSGAVSTSQGGAGGTASNGSATSGNAQNITINNPDNNDGQRDLAEAGVAAAAINAQASRDVAERMSDVKVRNVPSMVGPALISSNDTCMGSVSAAGAGPGFGISIGTTYKDDNCVMLKNSRELWNMGMKAASLALMCTDKANREALEITGFTCPQTEAANKKAAATEATSDKTASASTYTGNDPIVQARLGSQ